MKTRRNGSCQCSATCNVVIAFTLLDELCFDRWRELTARGACQPSRLRTGRNDAALVEDLAIEQHGRILEVIEFQRQISDLGYKRFKQMRRPGIPEGGFR